MKLHRKYFEHIYAEIAERAATAIPIVLIFPTAYSYEMGFFTIENLKTSRRNRLETEDD